MKKLSLLVFSVVLAAIVAGCTKGNVSGQASADNNEKAGEHAAGTWLFILNQGGSSAGSTLDVLDLTTNTYTADFYGQANPRTWGGLGNMGNDMILADGKLWVTMNYSNQVVALDPATGKWNRSSLVDSPRFMVTDGDNVYVSSYGTAVFGGDATKGLIYRLEKAGDIYAEEAFSAGYQPEGVAILDGKLYIANSGGYNKEKDNTISVRDLSSFEPKDPITLPVHNLYRLFSAGGKLWVSTYDTHADDFSITEAASLGSVTADGTYTAIQGVSPAIITCVGDTLYAGSGNQLWKISATDSAVTPLTLKDSAGKPFAFTNYPYGLAVHPTSGDIYIADASFTGNSILHCFGSDGVHKWQHDTGVGTGPLLVW